MFDAQAALVIGEIVPKQDDLELQSNHDGEKHQEGGASRRARSSMGAD
ncbi:hypothetical protein [Hyphomicrobium sp. CS1GBMeth3]|nr:hypothetical protein [Hyphomicrobium sp. CS1GBMeth3]